MFGRIYYFNLYSINKQLREGLKFMKQFIQPESIRLTYRSWVTGALKVVTILWEDIIKFEVKDITQSITVKDSALLKMDVINHLELVAKVVTCEGNSLPEIPLCDILSLDYNLEELTIIDSQDVRHIYGVSDFCRLAKEPKRSFNNFSLYLIRGVKKGETLLVPFI